MRNLNSVIAQIKDGMRDRLMADGRIVQISDTAEPDPRDLVASDGASFDQNYLPISVGLSLAAMGNSDKGFSWKERASPSCHSEASQFSLAARHADELGLLETLPDHQIGILDGSFWTELTNANQLIYSVSADDSGLRGGSSLRPLWAHLGEYVKEITRSDNGESMLRRVLNKKNVVGISKRGCTTIAFCKDKRYSDLFTVNETTLHLPDKAVMTYALEPGEYLRPGPLATGNFGCHTDADFGFSKADKAWFRHHFKNGIRQTFWKPHAAQPAYRIEYNHRGFEGLEIEGLLASIQSATTVLRVVEPLRNTWRTTSQKT